MPNEENSTHKRIDLTFFAKLLISIAIVLLVYGFYLDVGSSSRLIDPETAKKNSSKQGEAITMIDIYHWDDSVGEMDIIEEPIDDPSSKPHSSATATGKTKSPGKTSNSSNKPAVSGSTKPSSSPKPSTSPTPSSTPTPTSIPSPPTLDQTNNNLRNQIQNTYGVTVKYGLETAGYYVGGMSTNPITDASRANANLVKLNNAMSLYPAGFFEEIRAGGIPLTIYLIESFSIPGVTGVTDSTYSYANISIAVAYPFDDTFHHENYHYIERYMFKRGISFQSWDSYNPSDFLYTASGGRVMRDYSYVKTGSPDAYFVNDYAQTSADEDRASTFEYMMQSGKASCFTSGKPIWRKATIMSDSIDSVMYTVSPGTQEYWERHL